MSPHRCSRCWGESIARTPDEDYAQWRHWAIRHLSYATGPDAEEIADESLAKLTESAITRHGTLARCDFCIRLRHLLRDNQDEWRQHRRRWQTNTMPVLAEAPERDTRKGRRIQLVWQGVQQLPSLAREILIARFWDNKRFEQIAAEMGLSVEEVKRQLILALAQLALWIVQNSDE